MAGNRSNQDVVKDMKQLDQRILSLNKEKESQLYKRNPTLFSELSDMDKKISQDFVEERIKAKKEVKRLRTMVSRFHGELKNVDPTPQFLEKLKVIMEDIENNIMTFKESQREKYEELMLTEVQYSHEINALEKRFESWTETDQRDPTIATRKPVSKLPSARDVVKNLPPEVAQFEKFLQETGGVRGGWDEYDHSTFLKWRVRHKGKPQFISEAISHLPTKTPGEVHEHETWYRELLSHQDLKRLAIRAWKNKKNEKKAEGLDELSDSEEDEENAKTERRKQIIERERQQRAQKLGSWKLQKELERAEAEEKRLRQEREKLEKEQEEKFRQLELREKVSEYKRQRQEEQHFMDYESQSREFQHQEEKREKLRLNKDRIELRNHLALEQRTNHLREAEKKKAEQKRKEEKLKARYEVPVARDPNRLLRPTEGWKSRTKEVGASAESGRVYTMTHRAVPSWRQGL